MKIKIDRFVLTLTLILAFMAGSTVADANDRWQLLDNNRIAVSGTQYIRPVKHLSYFLDRHALEVDFMTSVQRSSAIRVNLPAPDGTFQEFEVTPVAVMHEDLAARYPQIKTFSGRGITDPAATARFDFTQFGFHGMVMSPGKTYFIDPFTLSDDEHYLVYYKKDFTTAKTFQCGVDDIAETESGLLPAAARSIGTELKTYRLAMAATGEYTAFYGGTVAGALAGIVTSINRVTGVYEREFAIRMQLVPNTDTLIFTNSSTDPYTNSNGGAMLTQNQTTVQARIGGSNYDIGHVFSTGGGGIAGLGVVCNFSQKARGVTGLTAPVNDPFDIDYVAHEIGHQYGGNHTFNSVTGACNGNRAGNAAYEPGSGSTIMAYAGICSGNNLQNNSDDYFHTKSFDEIITYTTTGIGANCPVITSTGNNPPVINPGGNYIIPYQTPFRLTGSATDPDGDTTLTYCWEQFDLGPAGTWSAPVSNAPIFRSFDPTPNPVRLFPKLANILSNTQTIGEVKPGYARTLHFKLTVRDNRLNGGGVTNNDTTVSVQVIDNGQPFAVTSPNVTGITWVGGGVETVTWSVGGSDLAPISTPTVNILLSTDGGQTFPTVLATGVPNNGTALVNVPVVLTTTARVMVEGNGNIFFDINDKNFAIGTVGIPEYLTPLGWQTGPNPVNSIVFVDVTDPLLLKKPGLMFELFDVTGRLSLSVPVTDTRQQIETAALSKGLYVAKLVCTENRNLGLIKLIKH
jgi:hypothetical protein